MTLMVVCKSKMVCLWHIIRLLHDYWWISQARAISYTARDNIHHYYIRLYFTVLLLARSNTRDIPFSNILISKKQFLCNTKSYYALVQNQWMKLRGTTVQYVFFFHRNWFLLINVRKIHKIWKFSKNF
jgi:hypothetical protein